MTGLWTWWVYLGGWLTYNTNTNTPKKKQKKQVRLELQRPENTSCSSTNPQTQPQGQGWAITALLSPEGEEVPLRRPVRFNGATPVREWLATLEAQMRITLAHALAGALRARGEEKGEEDLATWAGKYPAQVVILALQVQWTDGVERALAAKNAAKALAEGPLAALEALLRASAQSSSSAEGAGGEGNDALLRRKLEQAITVAVQQRDATRALLARAQEEAGESMTGRPPHQQAFEWLRQLRFYWSPPPPGEVDKDDDDGTALLAALTVRMADAAFPYGFEYLGVGERLVQTPLTDRCYLTLTQALHHGMGGNPFGPAGACVRACLFLGLVGMYVTRHTTGASTSPWLRDRRSNPS